MISDLKVSELVWYLECIIWENLVYCFDFGSVVVF